MDDQSSVCVLLLCFFFLQAQDGIRDLVRSRGLGDVYKRQRCEHPGRTRSTRPARSSARRRSTSSATCASGWRQPSPPAPRLAGVPTAVDVAALAEAVRSGSRAHIARAITLGESSRADPREAAAALIRELTASTGSAVRVGISGVPGAGKSTFIDAMGCRLLDRGSRVAVVAVDPSSRRTGGSILGDRTRMAAFASREGAFVRPSPSGRHLGGVARATRESMLVLEAAGYDVLIVETVGVGQNEIAVSEMVDTFLLLTLARAGDQLQGIKRGILELADVIAVNKADGDGEGPARVAARELAGAMRLMMPGAATRRPPVLTCSALTLSLIHI